MVIQLSFDSQAVGKGQGSYFWLFNFTPSQFRPLASSLYQPFALSQLRSFFHFVILSPPRNFATSLRLSVAPSQLRPFVSVAAGMGTAAPGGESQCVAGRGERQGSYPPAVAQHGFCRWD